MADAFHSAATLPASAPPTVELGPGAKIGRYAILERVGAGGMGVVYAAYDPELDRRVAIKVLASDMIGEEARLRLLREAQAMARLSHPNVVPIYDVGTSEGRVFVAMEFVQGVTLRNWLAETRDWTEVLEALRRAALGLQAAHEAGLVHRDFKPDNVMVGDDGRVRVLDFGLARSASPDGLVDVHYETTGSDLSSLDVPNGHRALSVRVTSDGAMLGTPAYMPPEQLEGRSVDARTDQWSFCVTLYEGLYGSRPFQGETVAAFVLSMYNEGIRPPPESSPVPSSVFAAVARGLELEPDARHPSIRALLDALELPPPARSRLVPVAVFGLGGVVLGGWWWSAQRADDACEARMLGASEIWSADAQRAGAEAFERSAAGYGGEAWERASGRVSEYVAAWGREAERACRAAGPETAEIDALRTRCLDARLRRLSTVVDAFSTANEHVVRGAVEAAFQLPELEPCADVPALLATVRPPEDPDRRAALDRLEVALADAAVFRLSGDYAEGSAQAEAVVQRARDLDFGSFTAEALRLQASLEAHRGHYDVARDLYVEAFELAATARDDAGAVEAAVALLSVVGSALQVPAAADAWATVAATMLERAGLNRRAAEARFHQAAGDVATARGDHARGLSEYAAARDLWEALPGDHPVEIGAILGKLGAAHAELGHYDEATHQHLRALEVQRNALGGGHPAVADSLHSLSRVHEASGRLVEAIEAAEQMEAVAQRSGADAFVLSRARIRLGQLRWRHGEELAAARELVVEASEVMAQTPDREPEVQAEVRAWLQSHPLPE